MNDFEPRDLLIYLSHKYEGDWEKIYQAVHLKEKPEKEEILKVKNSIKCKTVTMVDPNYPHYLHASYHPPFVLYYYGDLGLVSTFENNIAIVGARNSSKYGEEVTNDIVGKLSHDFVVVSGMARGIDAVAHNSALSHEGKTVAVLGSGIDVPYPASNKDLYEKIKSTNNLIISEYPPKCAPKREYFPNRNRLIAAFAKALLVSEAYSRSGTMITVYDMLCLGREVMCLPHLATSGSACNKLIKEGAYLVENEEDVYYIMTGRKKLIENVK